MSQLVLQSHDGLSRAPQASTLSSARVHDRPTISRIQFQDAHYSSTATVNSTVGLGSPSGSFTAPIRSSRSHQRPSLCPLPSITVISPLASPNSGYSGFPSSRDPHTTSFAFPRVITTKASELHGPSRAATAYYDSDSSYFQSPVKALKSPRAPTCALQTPRPPNICRTVSDSVVTKKTLGAVVLPTPPGMAGPSTASRSASDQATMRTPPIDSTVSATPNSSAPNKSTDTAPGSPDIVNLIETAGSPEAVIQYLLKEKASQAQQNTQLWRLVDKQRAMILGLNKDLEKALKEKEKYRKKLKESTATPELPRLAAVSYQPAQSVQESPNTGRPSKWERAVDIPASPLVDSDSQKSPIDVSMAPYPITPPADRLTAQVNGPQSAVGDLLDPSHSMPKPYEFAYGSYDHEEEEREDRAIETARKEADDAEDLPIHLSLSPFQAQTNQSPRTTPPECPGPLPPTSAAGSPVIPESGLFGFPAPPSPSPRKAPPAPLQLDNAHNGSARRSDDNADSEVDHDDVLEVDEISIDDRRGRRRTREEDERDREIIAIKEAEIRSLSKKSKQSNGWKETPIEKHSITTNEIPPSPSFSDKSVNSLIGVINGTMLALPASPTRALRIQGLPASPRPPLTANGSLNLSLVSPSTCNFAEQPLWPQSPGQQFPWPPNTPLLTPSLPVEMMQLTSPKPLVIKKQVAETARPPSPTRSSQESPVERNRVYKGFVTEEFPDLLLPPNALASIDIKVASSRMKPSRASLLSLNQLEEDPVFTLAVYSRIDGGELWRVEKDLASLCKLDHRLRQCQAFTAKAPDRSLFTGHAPAKLDARRVALNQYLDELLNTALDQASGLEVCKYLSSNTLPPNADDTGHSVGDTADEVPAAGAGGRPFKKGYLTKRGKNFGGWKARFFVLDGPHLKYYETPGGPHLGTIKLQKAQIGKQSQQAPEGSKDSPGRAPTTEDADNQYRHAFLILEPKKKDPNSMTKHILCAESDKERDQWVDSLLRWIDFKDPNEDEPRKDAAPERHGHQGGGNGAHAKKKTTPGTKQLPQHHQQHYPQQHHHQQHHQSQQPQPLNKMEERLIGMSYETTRQGHIPQGAPPSTDGHALQSISSQPNKLIQVPQTPHVTALSETRGGKPNMGLTPPTQEEKKVRKRSFFGFGTKARTSGDGQDSLLGNESNSSLGAGGGGGGGQYNGPVRHVFGATLGEGVRYNAPSDVRVPLPAVVYRCIQYLDAKHAIQEEGIFRLSGSSIVIRQLKDRFNTEGDVNLVADDQYYDIHAVASLLKAYLRELPTSILTRDLHVDFLSVTEMSDQQEKLAALSELVPRLPQANATLLKYLIAFLIKIINNASINKMTVRNVGIVFSPTLNIPAPVFAMFLQHYQAIFGIDPTEYQLPSPESGGQERYAPVPVGLGKVADAYSQGRPSTSSGSPHRQRLMEAVMERQQSRGSRTPPPLNMQQMAQMNALRSGSTPPPLPGHQVSYDPTTGHSASQANRRLSVSMPTRVAYETHGGYEPSLIPVGSRPNPGYDQPHYGYEQSYSARNRRESALFMGALGHKASKSRLRDQSS